MSKLSWVQYILYEYSTSNDALAREPQHHHHHHHRRTRPLSTCETAETTTSTNQKKKRKALGRGDKIA